MRPVSHSRSLSKKNQIYALHMDAESRVGQITMLQGVLFFERANVPDKKKDLYADAAKKYREAIQSCLHSHSG